MKHGKLESNGAYIDAMKVLYDATFEVHCEVFWRMSQLEFYRERYLNSEQLVKIYNNAYIKTTELVNQIDKDMLDDNMNIITVRNRMNKLENIYTRDIEQPLRHYKSESFISKKLKLTVNKAINKCRRLIGRNNPVLLFKVKQENPRKKIRKEVKRASKLIRR